jgi:hypothetical protein
MKSEISEPVLPAGLCGCGGGGGRLLLGDINQFVSLQNRDRLSVSACGFSILCCYSYEIGCNIRSSTDFAYGRETGLLVAGLA